MISQKNGPKRKNKIKCDILRKKWTSTIPEKHLGYNCSCARERERLYIIQGVMLKLNRIDMPKHTE